MADRAIAFRTEIVPASKVPTDPVRCPSCNSPDITLYGQVAYPARVSFSGGQEVDKFVDTSTSKNFEVDVIDCLSCHVRTEIQPDAENILYLQNSELRDQITKLTGEDPYGERKC